MAKTETNSTSTPHDDAFSTEEDVSSARLISEAQEKADAKKAKRREADAQKRADKAAEKEASGGDKLAAAKALIAGAEAEDKAEKAKLGILDRFACTVHATQPQSHKVFKLHIPHPTRDIPVKIEGRCGILLKKGLPLYAIKVLEKAYTTIQIEVPEDEQKGSIGLTFESKRVPLYRVDMGEKVKSPDPIGKVGR